MPRRSSVAVRTSRDRLEQSGDERIAERGSIRAPGLN